MIKNTLSDFISFLKKPNDLQVKVSISKKIKTLLLLILVELIFFLLIAGPISYLVNKIILLKTDRFDYQNTTIITLLVSLVFVIPLVEEIIFRYVLRYNLLFSKIINRNKWDKFFPILVYSFSIAFGLVHITNYANKSALFFSLSPLIVLSQLTGGLVISYIRVRFSFVWGVLYHWTWNSFFLFLIPITTSLFTSNYQEKSTDYSIDVKEHSFFEPNNPQILKIDSADHKLKKIELKQYSLRNLLDTIYKKDQYYINDILIDVDFESKNGVSKEEFLKILQKNYQIQENKD